MIDFWQSLDNEIPVLNDLRFRSLDGDVALNQSESKQHSSTGRLPNNLTNNIYPYGNVPFNLLQQQIPADIKVGGGNGAGTGTTNKRPSFHQWPLVGNLFSNHGRSRFKSGGSGRKYEPQGQLTPPGEVLSKDSQRPQRPFSRIRSKTNQPTGIMTAEDQHKVEYYLLRQQQLHWQQQQLHQANRLVPAVRSWIPQRQVAPPPPPQWRPDASADPEVTRYPINNKPVVNQPPVIRNQPPITPPLRSSINTELTVGGSTANMATTNVMSSSTTTTVNSPVTLTTMTISNTLVNVQDRQPEIESHSVTGQTDSSATTTESISDAAILATTLLTAAMTPSANRQMNESMATNETTVDQEDLPSNVKAVVLSDDTIDSSSTTTLLTIEENQPEPLVIGVKRPNDPPFSYANVRTATSNSRSNSHQWRYIPINAVDRQSRQLTAQYYADSIFKTTAPDFGRHWFLRIYRRQSKRFVMTNRNGPNLYHSNIFLRRFYKWIWATDLFLFHRTDTFLLFSGLYTHRYGNLRFDQYLFDQLFVKRSA